MPQRNGSASQCIPDESRPGSGGPTSRQGPLGRRFPFFHGRRVSMLTSHPSRSSSSTANLFTPRWQAGPCRHGCCWPVWQAVASGTRSDTTWSPEAARTEAANPPGQASMAPAKPQRMLAAIVAEGGQGWFLKAVGAPEAMAEHAERFEQRSARSTSPRESRSGRCRRAGWRSPAVGCVSPRCGLATPLPPRS